MAATVSTPRARQMSGTGHPEGGRVTVRAAELAVRALAGGSRHSVPADDVASLAAIMMVRRLNPGQIVYASDERPDGVWLIRNGAVELTVGAGKHRMVAQVLRDGDVFGDIPLLTDRESPYYPHTARATTCLWLAADDFLRLLSDRPAIARLWLSNCATRFVEVQIRLMGLLEGALPQRTAVLLLSEARGNVVALPQATLAAMLGSPRPSLNRVLRAFQEQGLISLRYRQVRILDEAGLRRAAGGNDDTERG